jgi:hypothetical protein
MDPGKEPARPREPSWLACVRKWLKRNKVFFEIGTALLIAFTAVVANCLMFRQGRVLEIQASPVVACARSLDGGRIVYTVENRRGYVDSLKCVAQTLLLLRERHGRGPMHPSGERASEPTWRYERMLAESFLEDPRMSARFRPRVAGPPEGVLVRLEGDLLGLRDFDEKLAGLGKERGREFRVERVRVLLDITYRDAIRGGAHVYGIDDFRLGESGGESVLLRDWDADVRRAEDEVRDSLVTTLPADCRDARLPGAQALPPRVLPDLYEQLCERADAGEREGRVR